MLRDFDGCGRAVIGVEELGWLLRERDWCGGTGMAVEGLGWYKKLTL